MVVQGFSHQLWSMSAQYKTMIGPLFMPVYDMEPPVLNYSDLRLRWQIETKTSLPYTLISEKTFVLRTDDGQIHKPVGVTLYQVNQNGHLNILKYYNKDEIPKELLLRNNVLIELWYISVYYAKIKWYDFQPQISVHGQTYTVSSLRFFPKRDRQVKWFVLPFAFMPVR